MKEGKTNSLEGQEDGLSILNLLKEMFYVFEERRVKKLLRRIGHFFSQLAVLMKIIIEPHRAMIRNGKVQLGMKSDGDINYSGAEDKALWIVSCILVK